MEETITVAAGFDIVLGPSFFIMMVIVFLAGIIRGFTGFGSALLIVPALAMLYGPAQAVVIEVLIEIPVSLGLLPLAFREAERKTVLPMLGMFVLFVPFGTLLLTLVNPDYVKVIISLFVLVSVGLMSQQLRIANLFSPKANFLVGAVARVFDRLVDADVIGRERHVDHDQRPLNGPTDHLGMVDHFVERHRQRVLVALDDHRHTVADG